MPQAAPAIRVRTLNHFGLAVSDTRRSVDFYRDLFGMPIQARSRNTTILRVGTGPQFLSIAPADGAPPSINHFCLGVEGFNIDRIMAALAARGVAKADAAGPMKAAVTMRDGTPDLLFGDPDGIVCSCRTRATAAARVRWATCAHRDVAPERTDRAARSQSHDDLLDRRVSARTSFIRTSSASRSAPIRARPRRRWRSVRRCSS